MKRIYLKLVMLNDDQMTLPEAFKIQQGLKGNPIKCFEIPESMDTNLFVLDLIQKLKVKKMKLQEIQLIKEETVIE